MILNTTARVAPEKQFHRLPAAGFSCDYMEMDMRFSEELETEVFINQGSGLSIKQASTECFHCGCDEVAIVVFSSTVRVREVAKEMLRLADEMDALDQGAEE